MKTALIERFHNAKITNAPEVICWGDGSPLREFMYVDDLADLCVFLLNNYSSSETINAGTGEEISIFNLAKLIKEIIGYKGAIVWDNTMPNGTPRKLLDIKKIKTMKWESKTSLKEGIKLTYQDYLTHLKLNNHLWRTTKDYMHIVKFKGGLVVVTPTYFLKDHFCSFLKQNKNSHLIIDDDLFIKIGAKKIKNKLYNKYFDKKLLPNRTTLSIKTLHKCFK